MSRFSYCSLALLAALTVSSGAYARAAHSNQTFPPGVRASVTGTSEADIQRQWSEQARARWGTNSQDMQTPRDFAYRACMYDHGVSNP